MEAIVTSGYINGRIKLPPSKSITQRVLAAALLHTGKTIVHNAGGSADETSVLNIIKLLGATVSEANNEITIESSGLNISTATEINCGESGLAARLFIPIVTMSNQPITITGHGSLLSRPMNGIIDVLSKLGVQVTSNNGCLPITVQGPLKPTDIEIDGSLSSQFLSGLLFAYTFSSTQAANTIRVKDLKSKPYIDLTIETLKKFGCVVTNDAYETFKTESKQAEKQTIETTIESDWSSATFLLVAGAIGGNVTLEHLDVNSKQADVAILKVLESAGANIFIDGTTITTTKSRLNGFDFDATNCPDLFPALAILAACCDGESYIRGVHRLYHKESNRAESISEMLQQFDIFFSIEDDALYIEGARYLDSATIESYNDHRIAMAAAIGALRTKGTVIIENAGAVNKSYPAFFNDLISLGIKCTIND
jgi:3-phosphoshikimate 1-carboxyvinyltransferase